MIRSLLLALALAAPAVAQPRLDSHGDPLPDGALARFGTVRYRIGTVGPYALSPDGKTLAVETARELTFWDVETGRPARRIPVSGHRTDRPVPGRLAFSPDGEHLVRVLNRDLRLFDARTGRARVAIGLPQEAGSVVFFPRSARFAVLGAKPWVAVYDAATGRQLSMTQTDAPAHALSPSGRFLLGTDYPNLLLMDAATGRVTGRIRTNDLFDPAYALTPDEHRLYAFVPRGFLFGYDTATGTVVEELLRPPDWKLYPGLVGLDLSPDGTVAYLSQKGQRTARRDLRAGKWLDPLPVMPDGRLVPHPDGKRVLFLGTDGLLRRYDLAILRELPPPDGFVDYVAAVPSPTGRFVATVSGDESPRIDMFDDAGRRLWSDTQLQWWPTLHWTPGGRHLLVLARDRVALRDPLTGRWDQLLPVPPGSSPFSGAPAFPPGGRQFIVPFDNGQQVAIYDRTEFRPPTVKQTGVRGRSAVSPDGRTLAYDRTGDTLTLVDLATGKQTGPEDDPPDKDAWEYRDVAFSPDGSYLLTWRHAGVAILRDPATGQPKREIATGNQLTFAFSPDGLWLATGSPDGGVAVWDVWSGKQVWAKDGHRDAVTRVAFAGAGRLVSSSQDRTALLWDLRADRRPKQPLWEALGGEDAAEAYRAVWALADDPKGPELLRAKIPAEQVRAEQVQKWVADLGADRYAVREAASRELRDLGRLVEPDLRAARAVVRIEEARVRIDTLLGRLSQERTRREVIQARAVAAMELAGSEAAKKLLAEWAGGTPGARLTRDAKAALERLVGAGETPAPRK